MSTFLGLPCLEMGVDYNGNDVQMFTDGSIGTWRQCSKLCDNHDMCKVWTYRENAGCWLKSSDFGKIHSKNAISGRKGCKGEFLFHSITFID